MAKNMMVKWGTSGVHTVLGETTTSQLLRRVVT